MQKGMPVETVWMGSAGSRSSTERPRAAAIALRSCIAPKTGIVLPHRAEDAVLARLRRREADGDGTDVEIERDGLRAAQDWMVPVEPACGAERGMAGEVEFFLHGEDADVDAAFALDLRGREAG